MNLCGEIVEAARLAREGKGDMAEKREGDERSCSCGC